MSLATNWIISSVSKLEYFVTTNLKSEKICLVDEIDRISCPTSRLQVERALHRFIMIANEQNLDV